MISFFYTPNNNEKTTTFYFKPKDNTPWIYNPFGLFSCKFEFHMTPERVYSDMLGYSCGFDSFCNGYILGKEF